MIDKSNDDPCKDAKGDCNKATNLVDKYIDGLLDATERAFIKKHLMDCPGCNHGYEFEAMFHTRVSSISPVKMPVDVKENILLALGFPGLTSPMSGSFSALGSPDAAIDGTISSQFGIPKGSIPKGEIPRSDFFDDPGDSSST